jgi:hypothetical protein
VSYVLIGCCLIRAGVDAVSRAVNRTGTVAGIRESNLAAGMSVSLCLSQCLYVAVVAMPFVVTHSRVGV